MLSELLFIVVSLSLKESCFEVICNFVGAKVLRRVCRRLGDKTFGRKTFGRKIRTFGRQRNINMCATRRKTSINTNRKSTTRFPTNRR